jgi:hypothetical protein
MEVIGGPYQKMASLPNRGLLVNDFFDVALYAGSRVVSAVGVAIGSKVAPSTFGLQIEELN